MSVGLFIITHNRIGEELLRTAMNMLGGCPLNARTLAITAISDRDELLRRGAVIVDELNQGEGVLVLADMYGSTPSNIAHALRKHGKVAAVAGINLPMLVRVLNYFELDLAQLTQKALSGGSEGILACENVFASTPLDRTQDQRMP